MFEKSQLWNVFSSHAYSCTLSGIIGYFAPPRTPRKYAHDHPILKSGVVATTPSTTGLTTMPGMPPSSCKRTCRACILGFKISGFHPICSGLLYIFRQWIYTDGFWTSILRPEIPKLAYVASAHCVACLSLYFLPVRVTRHALNKRHKCMHALHCYAWMHAWLTGAAAKTWRLSTKTTLLRMHPRKRSPHDAAPGEYSCMLHR